MLVTLTIGFQQLMLREELGTLVTYLVELSDPIGRLHDIVHA